MEIKLASPESCTGCAACANVCHTGALSMRPDRTGFLFPVIDAGKCVNCGRCTKVCPALHPLTASSDAPRAFIVQHRDDAIRRRSTSGGAFTALAERVIDMGGAVYGAAFGEGFTVRHVRADTVAELAAFRSSKYVQSEMGECYRDAKARLDSGRAVLFSGTPCQIQGLRACLGRDYEKLLTVDFMCRAVPSPKILQICLAAQRARGYDFDRLVFRDKALGYSYSTLALYAGERCVYRAGSEADPWLRLFLGGYCNRESCYHCPFQTGPRVSDFTLWDCWGTQHYAPEWDDNRGTTNAIVWTEKGMKWLDGASEALRVREIGIENIDASLERRPIPRPDIDQSAFYADADAMAPTAFIKKYAPISPKIRLKSAGRKLIYRLGIYNAIRRAVHFGRRCKNGKLKMDNGQ